MERIASGIAILPTSCSDAPRRMSSTSVSLRSNLRATAAASSATPSRWSPRSGFRSVSACSSALLVCVPAALRVPCFCAYIRWSASLSASEDVRASYGRKIAPKRGRDGEAVAALAQGRRRGLREEVDRQLLRVEERAELVPAEPVRRFRGRGRRPRGGRRPSIGAISRRMPEGVVVGLEPVQIEDDEHVAARVVARASAGPGRRGGGGGSRGR